MPTVWLALKRTLHCKSVEPLDVHDPKTKVKVQDHVIRTIRTRKRLGRSGCSRSIENLRDVIHGKHFEKPPPCNSPRSIGSSELLNPITHEVVLSDSKCELKITGFHEGVGVGGAASGSTFSGTLNVGTPGPGGHFIMQSQTPSFRSSSDGPPRKSLAFVTEREGLYMRTHSISKASHYVDPIAGSSTVVCHKCGDEFRKWETLESHHLSKHAVTELVEGDPSRKVVEIICRTSFLKSESTCWRIERVLKVHNMQKTLARFEEYRDMVKLKASKLHKKHPRCLADGNELLRFFGTTAECSLGMSGSSNLCLFEKCNVCRIIKHGFTSKNEFQGSIGIFTTSTSGRALESIENCGDHNSSIRKALLICRVIAGRVHKPLENLQELVGQSEFDSLAGKMGPCSNVEELYLLNPKALLPCFVVICKQ